MKHYTELRPCDPALPSRREVEGVTFCGLFAVMQATLWYRVNSPALTNSRVPWDPSTIFPYVVELDMRVPDITIDTHVADPADTAWISVTITQPATHGPGSPEFVTAIRAVLHRALTHEADEGLLVDGVRVFDPHAAEVSG